MGARRYTGLALWWHVTKRATWNNASPYHLLGASKVNEEQGGGYLFHAVQIPLSNLGDDHGVGARGAVVHGRCRLALHSLSLPHQSSNILNIPHFLLRSSRQNISLRGNLSSVYLEF